MLYGHDLDQSWYYSKAPTIKSVFPKISVLPLFSLGTTARASFHRASPTSARHPSSIIIYQQAATSHRNFTKNPSSIWINPSLLHVSTVELPRRCYLKSNLKSLPCLLVRHPRPDWLVSEFAQIANKGARSWGAGEDSFFVSSRSANPSSFSFYMLVSCGRSQQGVSLTRRSYALVIWRAVWTDSTVVERLPHSNRASLCCWPNRLMRQILSIAGSGAARCLPKAQEDTCAIKILHRSGWYSLQSLAAVIWLRSIQEIQFSFDEVEPVYRELVDLLAALCKTLNPVSKT